MTSWPWSPPTLKILRLTQHLLAGNGYEQLKKSAMKPGIRVLAESGRRTRPDRPTMKPTAQRNALSGTSSTLVSIVLLAELAACASNPSAGDGASLVGTGEDGGALIESSTSRSGITIQAAHLS